MPTFKGFDVLEQMPDPTGGIAENSFRDFEVFDPGLGSFEAQTRGRYPVQGRTLLWKCMKRSDVTALRQFIDARKGRLVPFWLPSFARDMMLVTSTSVGAQTFNIFWCGYSTLLFPAGNMRRHLRIDGSAGAFYRTVTTAAENDPFSENITVDTVMDVSIDQNTLVSFMRLCRLDADDAHISWQGSNYAEVRLPFVELPFEVPS